MTSPSPAGDLPFPDDLLADILICLPTLADFGRACVSCPAFRRVITARSFLRRLHALHPPSLLGTRTFFGFYPVRPPHPSAAAARALADAADFRFSFLPKPGFWMVRDERGGRFVVDCDDGTATGRGGTFTTIAVCDPLFRRYELLPPIPADLAATVDELPHIVDGQRRCGVFLAPCPCAAEVEEEAGTGTGAFMVVWVAQCATKLHAFVFSSASGQWRAVAPATWSDLSPYMPSVIPRASLRCRNYSNGRFYWIMSEFPFASNLIALDMDRMRFFHVNHPHGPWLGSFAIVDLGENMQGMFVFARERINNEGRVLRLYSANRETHGDGASEWVLENELLLPRPYRYNMLGVADGKLLLLGTNEPTPACIISLDFKTLQRQEIQGMIHRDFRLGNLYLGYPPSLSLPTI